jgi:hypothetical protein
MGRNAGEKTWAAEKPFLLNVSHVCPEPVLAKCSLFCKEKAVQKKGGGVNFRTERHALRELREKRICF